MRFFNLPLSVRAAQTCKQKHDEEYEPTHTEAVYR
jgi:hypothetical protein